MMQIDQEFMGRDFSASLKTINPSILEGGVTGVFMGSYFQSVTPSLALGLEAMWSRASTQMGPESTISYAAKYKTTEWIASAQLAGMGSLNASYWRRLTEKVEVGTELALQVQPDMSGRGGMMGALQKHGSATLGAKYSFRTSVFRAQVDSAGKLSALLEKMIFPTVQVAFAGEIDHLKVPTSPHSFPSDAQRNFSTNTSVAIRKGRRWRICRDTERRRCPPARTNDAIWREYDSIPTDVAILSKITTLPFSAVLLYNRRTHRGPVLVIAAPCKGAAPMLGITMLPWFDHGSISINHSSRHV